MRTKTAGRKTLGVLISLLAAPALILTGPTSHASAATFEDVSSSVLSCGKMPVISAAPTSTESNVIRETDPYAAAQNALNDLFPHRKNERLNYEGSIEGSGSQAIYRKPSIANPSATTKVYKSKNSAVVVSKRADGTFEVEQVLTCAIQTFNTLSPHAKGIKNMGPSIRQLVWSKGLWDKKTRKLLQPKVRARMFNAIGSWNSAHPGQPRIKLTNKRFRHFDPRKTCGKGVQTSAKGKGYLFIGQYISFARNGVNPTWLGVTFECRFPNDPTHSRISTVAINTDSNFYKGTNRPSATQSDLWSVAVHEFGHALGLSHSPEGDPGCTGVPRHSMCSAVMNGDTSARSPDASDIEQFNRVY